MTTHGASAGERIKTFAELSRAILLRSALYAVILFLLLLEFKGSVDIAFLAVTVLVVIVMHEALHMVGMEALRIDHQESFKLSAVGYAALNASSGKIFGAMILPFVVFFPFGFLLITQTGIATYAAVGWSIIVLHAILLPIELVSMRAKSAQ